MATITSAASGDFSVGATWVGGVVPGVADDAVAATGHVIVIDVDTTVISVQQAGTGKYTLGDGRTLTANVIANAGTFTSGGTVDVVATTTAVINGNVTGVSTTTSNTAGVVVTGSGALTLNGNVTGSAGNNSSTVNRSAAVFTNFACSIIINGTLTGGSGQFKTALSLGSSSSGVLVTITGDILGGTSASANGIVSDSTNYNVTITGNLVARTTTNATPFQSLGSGTLTVTGNVTGGANDANGINATGISNFINVTGNLTAGNLTTGYAVFLTSTSGDSSLTVTGNVLASGSAAGLAVRSNGSSNTIVVTGNVTAGPGLAAHCIEATGASSTVNVVGSVTAASTLSHGINSSATANGVIMEGDMTDSLNGAAAIYARIFRMSATNTGVTTYTNTVGYPSGTPVSRVSPDNVTGMASQTDVRLNTVFGFNSELTGSLAVPPANAVGAGVPVDNTTGTAALTPGDIAGLVGAQIAAAVTSP